MPIIFRFDDSLDNTYSNAMPIMEEFGFKGVLNILPGYLGKEWHDVDPEGRDWGYREIMTLEEVMELSRLGWDIGSHSMNHRYFPELDIWKAVYESLYSFLWILVKVRKRPKTFAWPWGGEKFNHWIGLIYPHLMTIEEAIWDGRSKNVPVKNDYPPSSDGYAVWLFHGVREEGDPWEHTPDQFRGVCSDIESSGIQVMTLTEALYREA
jgi:hypothetical protein